MITYKFIYQTGTSSAQQQLNVNADSPILLHSKFYLETSRLTRNNVYVVNMT